MIEETGYVIAADREYVWVESASRDHCTHCSAKAGCGTASLQKWFKRKPNRLRLSKTQDLKPGDQVLIGIPEQALVKGSFLIYMLPLLALLAGAISGAMINDAMGWSMRDPLSLLLAFAALLLSLMRIKRYLHMEGQSSRYEAVILRRIS